MANNVAPDASTESVPTGGMLSLSVDGVVDRDATAFVGVGDSGHVQPPVPH